MLTEKDLTNDEVKAADDSEGVDILIQSLYSEIMKKRWKVVQLHRDKKSADAIELEASCDEMQKEMDNIIKSQLSYMKYLKAIGQDSKKPSGIKPHLKDQKSSLGAIVSIVPNK